MWANTLSRKHPVSARKPGSASCKAKEKSSAEKPVAIPASWELSDNQRSFIESLMEPASK